MSRWGPGSPASTRRAKPALAAGIAARQFVDPGRAQAQDGGVDRHGHHFLAGGAGASRQARPALASQSYSNEGPGR